MPKVVSKGNNKYGGHCDGGFSELTGGCIYDPERIIFGAKNVQELNRYSDHSHLRFHVNIFRKKNKRRLQTYKKAFQ